jgi:hypothetical protein
MRLRKATKPSEGSGILVIRPDSKCLDECIGDFALIQITTDESGVYEN